MLLAGLMSDSYGHHASAQESASEVGGWMAAYRPSVVEDEGLPWIEGITASFYGVSSRTLWGGYGNRLYPETDYFCALPANMDSLDCLGGHLACRVSRCGEAQPLMDRLLSDGPSSEEDSAESFEFWPGSNDERAETPWIIEGEEGDGLFRVIEIRPSGRDGPILEAYIGDVGPWGNSDPYWATGSRPQAEDGVDSRGRMTNRAGIDISYALARELGCTGLMQIDWRWKTVDGAYAVRRQPTDWRW